MAFIVKRFCVMKEVDIVGVGKGGAPVCVVMVPSFGMRMAVGGRGGRPVEVMMQVVEGDDEHSLGHTKFEQPGRHGSSRDSVRGTSSDSLLRAPLSASTQFVAALFCHVHHAFQRWIEISNPLMSPLCL